MHQLEECEDGTGRVCLLIKTLYGLKQAGCKWSHQLDQKLKTHTYQCLLMDPCVYI